jgi:hypothetical protein
MPGAAAAVRTLGAAMTELPTLDPLTLAARAERVLELHALRPVAGAARRKRCAEDGCADPCPTREVLLDGQRPQLTPARLVDRRLLRARLAEQMARTPGVPPDVAHTLAGEALAVIGPILGELEGALHVTKHR